MKQDTERQLHTIYTEWCVHVFWAHNILTLIFWRLTLTVTITMTCLILTLTVIQKVCAIKLNDLLYGDFRFVHIRKASPHNISV